MEAYMYLWIFLSDFFYPSHMYPQKVRGGFIPWDTISVAYLSHPQLFSDHKYYTIQWTNGKLMTEPCDDLGDHRGRVTVPMVLDREAFDKELMEHLLSIPALF